MRGMRLGLLAVGCLVATVGCTPKRVIDGRSRPAGAVATAPAKKPARKPAPKPAPPAEEPTATVNEPQTAVGEVPADNSRDTDQAPTYSDLPEPEFYDRFGLPRPRTSSEGLKLGFAAAELAREQLGKQYQWGAVGPDRFDCSGLVYYVYGSLGVALPRVSADQARFGTRIGRSEVQPGDLLFFSISGSRVDHVGIYVGGNEFIHAPRKHMPVRTDSLNDAWWRRRFEVARRVK